MDQLLSKSAENVAIPAAGTTTTAATVEGVDDHATMNTATLSSSAPSDREKNLMLLSLDLCNAARSPTSSTAAAVMPNNSSMQRRRHTSSMTTITPHEEDEEDDTISSTSSKKLEDITLTAAVEQVEGDVHASDESVMMEREYRRRASSSNTLKAAAPEDDLVAADPRSSFPKHPLDDTDDAGGSGVAINADRTGIFSSSTNNNNNCDTLTRQVAAAAADANNMLISQSQLTTTTVVAASTTEQQPPGTCIINQQITTTTTATSTPSACRTAVSTPTRYSETAAGGAVTGGMGGGGANSTAVDDVADDNDEGDDDSDEDAWTESSPEGRYRKSKKRVPYRDVPGIDGAYYALDADEGVEVVWNEIFYPEPELFAEREQKLHVIFNKLTTLQHWNLVKIHNWWCDTVPLSDADTNNNAAAAAAISTAAVSTAGAAAAVTISEQQLVVAVGRAANMPRPRVCYITELMDCGILRSFLARTKNVGPSSSSSANSSSTHHHHHHAMSSFGSMVASTLSSLASNGGTNDAKLSSSSTTAANHRPKMPFKIWRRWCCQLLSGLRYLHESEPPITHGNLNLDTIFMEQSGLLKIGSVSPLAIDQNFKMVRPRVRARNAHFLAPEYGCRGHMDPSVDIYAFGMVALEMLTYGLSNFMSSTDHTTNNNSAAPPVRQVQTTPGQLSDYAHAQDIMTSSINSNINADAVTVSEQTAEAGNNNATTTTAAAAATDSSTLVQHHHQNSMPTSLLLSSTVHDNNLHQHHHQHAAQQQAGNYQKSSGSGSSPQHYAADTDSAANNAAVAGAVPKPTPSGSDLLSPSSQHYHSGAMGGNDVGGPRWDLSMLSNSSGHTINHSNNMNGSSLIEGVYLNEAASSSGIGLSLDGCNGLNGYGNGTGTGPLSVGSASVELDIDQRSVASTTNTSVYDVTELLALRNVRGGGGGGGGRNAFAGGFGGGSNMGAVGSAGGGGGGSGLVYNSYAGGGGGQTGGPAGGGVSSFTTVAIPDVVIQEALESIEANALIRDFIVSCLNVDAAARPTAKQLLFHKAIFQLHSLKLLACRALIRKQLGSKQSWNDETIISRTGRNKNAAFAEVGSSTVIAAVAAAVGTDAVAAVVPSTKQPADSIAKSESDPSTISANNTTAAAAEESPKIAGAPTNDIQPLFVAKKVFRYKDLPHEALELHQFINQVRIGVYPVYHSASAEKLRISLEQQQQQRQQRSNSNSRPPTAKLHAENNTETSSPATTPNATTATTTTINDAGLVSKLPLKSVSVEKQSPNGEQSQQQKQPLLDDHQAPKSSLQQQQLADMEHTVPLSPAAAEQPPQEGASVVLRLTSVNAHVRCSLDCQHVWLVLNICSPGDQLPREINCEISEHDEPNVLAHALVYHNCINADDEALVADTIRNAIEQVDFRAIESMLLLRNNGNGPTTVSNDENADANSVGGELVGQGNNDDAVSESIAPVDRSNISEDDNETLPNAAADAEQLLSFANSNNNKSVNNAVALNFETSADSPLTATRDNTDNNNNNNAMLMGGNLHTTNASSPNTTVMLSPRRSTLATALSRERFCGTIPVPTTEMVYATLRRPNASHTNSLSVSNSAALDELNSHDHQQLRSSPSGPAAFLTLSGRKLAATAVVTASGSDSSTGASGGQDESHPTAASKLVPPRK